MDINGPMAMPAMAMSAVYSACTSCTAHVLRIRIRTRILVRVPVPYRGLVREEGQDLKSKSFLKVHVVLLNLVDLDQGVPFK